MDKQASTRKPLYGHDSEHNAYMIDDYPAGFRARCKKRVWLEFKAKQGWRLMEQTSEKWYEDSVPAEGARLHWNKPKASTYIPVAACMYLDENDHVQWAGLGHTANPAAVSSFLDAFPKADDRHIKAHIVYQFAYEKGKMEGRVTYGKPWNEDELGEARQHLTEWAEVAKKVGLKVPESIQNLIDGKAEAVQMTPEAYAQDRAEKAEAAAKARAEEAANTKGAMSRVDFIKLLESKVKLDGRVMQVMPERGDKSTVYVQFYNLLAKDMDNNAQAQNNKQTYIVEGFDRKDENAAVVKVKVTQHVNNLHRRGTPADQTGKMRAKSGTPDKVAAYLADFIHEVIKTIPPFLSNQHYASSQTVVNRFLDKE